MAKAPAAPDDAPHMGSEVLAAYITGGIGLLAALLSIVISGLSAYLSIRTTHKLQNLKEASRYSEPLARAAYFLSRRLYNIFETDLVDTYAKSEHNRTHINQSTACLFAEYFAWTEIVRRDIQLIDLGKDRHTRDLRKAVDAVADVFDITGRVPDPRKKTSNVSTIRLRLADYFSRRHRTCSASFRIAVKDLSARFIAVFGTPNDLGNGTPAVAASGAPQKKDGLNLKYPYFHIFTLEQREIGDWMIATAETQHADFKRLGCISYSAFLGQLGQEKLSASIQKFLRDTNDLFAKHRLEKESLRLRLVQNYLVDLLDVIDPNHIRFEGKHRQKVGLGVDYYTSNTSRNKRSARVSDAGAV